MRFVLYDEFSPGVLAGDRVVDISSILGSGGCGPQATVETFIARYDEVKPEIEALVARSGGVPLASVRLRQPVPSPKQLLCAIKNYIEAGKPAPEADFFLKSPLSIIGPGETVEIPPFPARVFHHEPELAVVLKSGGSNIAPADAMKHVFGYTGFIDISARDLGGSYYQKKSFRTFGPMGPALVTADEVGDPYNLAVKFCVNGQVKQDFTTADMANRIDRLIELASQVGSLAAGDVIATGTFHIGMGAIMDGDELTLEIEKVGTLSVNVVDPQKRSWDRP